jgi:hypothetical protein
MDSFKHFQRSIIFLFHFILIIIPKAHSQMNCTTYNISPVLTLTANPSTPVYGQPTTLQADFTYNGTQAYNNYITVYPKGITWTGGSFTTISSTENSSTISVNPSITTTYTAKITYDLVRQPNPSTVERVNNCSITKTITISTPVLSITSGVQNLDCGDITPKTYTSSSFPGASLYSWTWPAGWSGPATTSTNSATVTPNGTSGGDVKVSITVNGLTQTSAPYPVTVSIPPSISISGPSLLCTNGTFTLNNAPGGVITWSVTPSNLVTPSTGTGAIANLTKVSNGNATITYTSGCGTLPSFSFHTGPYSSSDYPISGPSSASCNQYVYYSIPNLTGSTSINWVWPSGWTYSGGQGSTNLALRTNGSGGVVSVGVNNTCGQSGSYATKYTSVSGYCGFSAISIYPNPTSSDLTISFMDTTATEIMKNTDQELESSYEVMIYNQYQDVIYTTRTSSRRFTISMSNFPNGSYTINLIHKEGIIQRRIFVNRDK